MRLSRKTFGKCRFSSAEGEPVVLILSALTTMLPRRVLVRVFGAMYFGLLGAEGPECDAAPEATELALAVDLLLLLAPGGASDNDGISGHDKN